MHEPLFTKKLAAGRFVFRFEKFWQSVLWFGLPFVILYHGSNYLAFRVATSRHPAAYPWARAITSAVLTMFAVSIIWWLLMREIAAWKRKNR